MIFHAVWLLLATESFASKDYSGHQLIRAIPKDTNHLDFLNELHTNYSEYDQVAFWKGPGEPSKLVDILVHPGYSTELFQQLSDAGMEPALVFDDMQRLVEDEKRSVSSEDRFTDEFVTSRYHTYAEINQWMKAQASKCPDICEVFKIGYSFEGRPMNVFKISANRNAPAVWIDAGLHAREWIAPATAIFILQKLLEGIDNEKTEAHHLLNSYTWYILPVANPDGYVYTWTTDRLWRKTRSVHPFSNCIGADPNRNWNFHWGGPGTSSNPCSENFHGRFPFSEPETRAMANYLWRIRKEITIYLSFHSYGQYWLTPWGFTYLVPEDYNEMVSMGTLATTALGRINGTQYSVGSSSRMLYLASGGSDDWIKAVARVKYSYTVELRDTGHHGFMLPPQYIASTANEIYHAVKTMGSGVLRQKRRRLRRKRRNLKSST